ncbi:MAG: phosphotriesterase family protein [Brevinematia bacterium]
MSIIRTVLGDIKPEDLGFTYTHEHLICRPPDWKLKDDPDLELSDVDKAIKELRLFYESGGRALVEGTCIDYGRKPEKLREIARQVPVHIIATTGFNKGSYYPSWVIQMDIDNLTQLFVKEITLGMEDTNIKAGQIKIGSSYNVITDQEEKVTRAAARAQRLTGAPVWIHTENGTMGLEQLELLKKEGADLTKVAVGHSDRNPDPAYHLAIVRTGAYIQFDCISKVKYYSENLRIELIENILGHGYEDQLLISGDMGRRSYLRSYGGGPGFEFIISKFTKRLLQESFSEKAIGKIFVENPAKWLQF